MPWCTIPWTFGAARIMWEPAANYNNCTVGAYGAQIDLGVSEEGVNHQYQPRWDPVPADDFGGSAGLPADMQFLGAQVVLDFTLSKFDVTDAGNGLARLNKIPTLGDVGGLNLSAGTLPPFGTFMRAQAMFGRLELRCGTGLANGGRRIVYPVTQVLDYQTGMRMRHRVDRFRMQVHVDNACSRILYQILTGVDPCQ